jgi:hypothetical protein
MAPAPGDAAFAVSNSDPKGAFVHATTPAVAEPNPVPNRATPQREAHHPGDEAALSRLALGGLGWVVFVWSVGGVAWLLGRAVVRLGRVAADAFTGYELGWDKLVFLVLWVAFMGYAEGYRELQRKFAPRVVRRAYHLAANPRWHSVLLGPAYAIGLVHATRRRLITSWSIVLGIVALVILVRHAPQPWRGLVDTGVVVGLSWGLVGMGVEIVRLLRGREAVTSLDLPGAEHAPTP